MNESSSESSESTPSRNAFLTCADERVSEHERLRRDEGRGLVVEARIDVQKMSIGVGCLCAAAKCRFGWQRKSLLRFLRLLSVRRNCRERKQQAQKKEAMENALIVNL
jgi:hypothetical protein